MNELLKGLIGAELTLLGMGTPPGSSPTAEKFPAPAGAGKRPGTTDGDTAREREESPSKIGFSQRDYRTAGG